MRSVSGPGSQSVNSMQDAEATPSESPTFIMLLVHDCDVVGSTITVYLKFPSVGEGGSR